LKVRVLGCGTSTGVPKIGNHWGECDPGEPRNRRLRSSILISTAEAHVLVDCGPDLREQLLGADVDRLSAVIVTHDHGDHVHGLDELRPVAQATGGPVPMLGRVDVLDSLRARFAYAFAQSDFYRPIAATQVLGENWTVDSCFFRFVDQPHGETTSLGIRVDQGTRSLVYAIDYNDMTDAMMTLYENADVLVSDCLTRQPHPTHAHLNAVLGWARDLRVGQLYLSHMGNGLDYRSLAAELPDWAEPAYDGLEIAW